MRRATTSLPTPLSPVMRTLAPERAACSTSSSTARMAALTPSMVRDARIILQNDYQDKNEHSRRNPPKKSNDFLKSTQGFYVAWYKSQPLITQVAQIQGKEGDFLSRQCVIACMSERPFKGLATPEVRAPAQAGYLVRITHEYCPAHSRGVRVRRVCGTRVRRRRRSPWRTLRDCARHPSIDRRSSP